MPKVSHVVSILLLKTRGNVLLDRGDPHRSTAEVGGLILFCHGGRVRAVENWPCERASTALRRQSCLEFGQPLPPLSSPARLFSPRKFRSRQSLHQRLQRLAQPPRLPL